jgi:glycosyltransferase involved in cell wall biosynthesis
MPSVWEEAYGFAGMEFLAKGIPVVANAIGGMTDYVREGKTGWLNGSRSSEELAGIMAGIVERPQQVLDLNAAIRAARHEIVKPIAAHADEMDAVYGEVAGAVRR